MKPTKIVHERKQSAPAQCGRETGHSLSGFTLRCFAPLQLVVTRNPIGALPYDELVVTRCLAGHIADSQGVLPEVRA